MRINLLTQILVAFVIAVISGAFVGEPMVVVKPLGDLFLNLIKFIIVPLVLSSLVVGVASTGSPKTLGRIGGKTVAYYLATTLVAVVIGLALGFLFAPGAGGDIQASGEKFEQPETKGVVETLLAIVPTNPFAALAEGNILQIIFLAIFIGVAMTLVGEKAGPVHRFFDSLAEVMYKITGIVMRFAPVGVFGLIAPVVAEHGLSVLLPLIKVILAVAVGCMLHACVIYSLAVKSMANMSPLRFFKAISPAATIAFSTASSSGTLPVTLKNTQENLGVSNKIASFVLPLGATVNMDGTAIYQGVAVLFIAEYYGSELTFAGLLTVVLTAVLASIGTAGVPGAGLIMLTLVLSSVNLPLEGIALIAGIDRILDMFRTCVNVVGDASAAVVVAASEKELTTPQQDTATVAV